MRGLRCSNRVALTEMPILSLREVVIARSRYCEECFSTTRQSHAQRRSNLMSKQMFVYIMTNKNNTVLYTGVTNNLKRRTLEHREGIKASFTKKYNVHKLVYYELFSEPYCAIAREKQIKAGPRRKKMELINTMNPDWHDLFQHL